MLLITAVLFLLRHSLLKTCLSCSLTSFNQFRTAHCTLPPSVSFFVASFLSLPGVDYYPRDLACCYLCLQARHWKPALAAVWIVAWFSRAVESDLLRSIFYTRPQWPGALCSSWNTLLCDRCHIKQHSSRPPPASKIPPLSLCNGLSSGHVLDCGCAYVCVRINQWGEGSQRLRPSESHWTCVHMFTLKHLIQALQTILSPWSPDVFPHPIQTEMIRVRFRFNGG